MESVPTGNHQPEQSLERQRFLEGLKQGSYIDYNRERYVFVAVDDEDKTQAWIHPSGNDKPELVSLADICPPEEL